ncbi:rod shape-determining protein MreC, partial [Patescibacteria group bacterium]|nr:rod shape-determining protein MreC [Patescibacteria group bacterium]
MTVSHKLLVISAVLLLTGGLFPFTYLNSISHRFMFPVQVGIHTLSINAMDEVVFLKKIRGVKEELFELYKIKEQKISLSAQVVELELENKTLKNQLGFSENIGRKMVMASVTGAGFGSSASLVLNAGEILGVKVGNAVLYENYLIGIISFVSPNSSTVKLLNDPDAKVLVLSQNSRAKGIVVGNYGTTALMKNILINESIDLGDMVVTSGEDLLIPKGLVIGRVTKINFKEEEILKSAEVELGVNPRKLEMVFVMG